MPKITRIQVCKKEDSKTVCRRPTQGEIDVIVRDLSRELRHRGIDCDVFRQTSTSVNLSECRLTLDYVGKYGYNQSPYTGRRGKVLGWEDWIEFNDALNDVLDKHDVEANAHSLSGKFLIREGDTRFDRDDWDNLTGENVGSMMRPVAREDAWSSEGRGRHGWRKDKKR